MAKNQQIAVRSHQQELEWLRTLGKGSITNGVKSLIKRDRNGYAKRNDSILTRKSKK